jgi:hypothetical protein
MWLGGQRSARFVAVALALVVSTQLGCVTNSSGLLMRTLRFRPFHVRHIREAPQNSGQNAGIYDLLRLTTRDGELTVLYSWRFDQRGQSVFGEGMRFDSQLHRYKDGEQIIAFADLTLIEGVRRPQAMPEIETSRIFRWLASQAATSAAMASAEVLCREMNANGCAVPIERGSAQVEPIWDTYADPGEPH